ncbi:MAG: M50 family metallopeptidase [Candidatus Magasanikbacteria bacterium]
MRLLYYLYELLTAPGVMMHELGHAVFCLSAGVRVYRIRLFQFGRTAGFVEHEEPNNFFQGFLISVGPLIINSLFALFAFAKFNFVLTDWHSWVWLYFGVAVGLHAIPSDGDDHSLLVLANRRFWKNPLVIIGYPFILLLYIFYLLKRLHIDWLYVFLLFWLGHFYLKQ